jgi:predicted RNA-binding protein
MCEANVYLLEENGEKSLFFDSVDKVIPQEDGRILMENIFGERKTVLAEIKWMELVDHKIFIARRKSCSEPSVEK